MYTLYYDDGRLCGFVQEHFMENGRKVLCIKTEYLTGEWILFGTRWAANDYLHTFWNRADNKKYVSIVKAPTEIFLDNGI